MQRGRGGRDDFFGGFGDPFAGFPGFGGRPGSLISSFFGGRDPFDDPFFTQPFGSMMGPSMMGPSVFGPSMFGSGGSVFGESTNTGFLEQQAAAPHNRSNGPIIEEISSDGEEGEENEGNRIADEKKENPRKHSRSSREPYVQDPDEAAEEKKSRSVQHRSEFNRTSTVRPQAQTYNLTSTMRPQAQTYNLTSTMRPQAQTYNFQSSTVTYGGLSGPYYTASTTRRMGGDGVAMEESKEADSTTGKATHRVSRGIHDKGHTLTRKLNSDGRVDSLQTLHNLNEDELSGFDETWKGKARQHLPGWNQGYDTLENRNTGGRTGSRHEEQPQRGWALPSTGQPSTSGRGMQRARSNSSSGGGQ